MKAVVGVALLGLILVTTGAVAQTTTRRAYDASGREVGRAEIRPEGSARYYRLTGRSERKLDGTTQYFGRIGPPVRYGALGG